VRGIALVIEAANVILRHLAEVPDGAEARVLREKALDCIQEVATWRSASPSAEIREAMMKRVLALHVEVRKLMEPDER
jgi:hypothetical protein